MKTAGLTALVLSAALCAPIGDAAAKVIDKGYGWEFWQDGISSGTLCRAARKTGGQLYIMAWRTTGTGYITLNTPSGAHGTYPNARLNLKDGPLRIKAQVNGTRLAFDNIDKWSLDAIAQNHGYSWVLSRDLRGVVDLGNRSTDALDRVFQCVRKNR